MKAIFHLLHLTAAELVNAPLLWCVIFALPFAALAFVLVRFVSVPRLVQWEARLLLAGAAGLIATFVASALIYLFAASFGDHVEPLVALNSWLFWRGEPIYHALETQQRHTTPYGPYLYIFHALAQAALGPSTFSSKLMAVLAAPGSLFFLYGAIARAATRSSAVMFTGVAAGLSLAFEYVAFWNRTDPFLILAVSAALFAATHRGAVAAIAFGAAIGVAVDMKTHGGFYFVPLAVLAWRNGWRFRDAVTAAVSAAVIAILPFAAFSNVTFSDYRFSIEVAAGYDVGPAVLRYCLAWLLNLAMLALAPAILARFSNRSRVAEIDRRTWAVAAAILVSSLPILVPAAQMGSGPHHFLPFIPLLVFFAAETAQRVGRVEWHRTPSSIAAQSVRYSWLLSCALVALWMTYARAEHVVRTRERFVGYERDVRRIIAAHPEATLLMGLGADADYWHTFARHQLVFAGMPPGVDPMTMMDFKGRALPESSVALLEQELKARNPKPPVWLIPRNAEPFSMRTWYEPTEILCSDKFRTDFAEHYERTASAEFFDIYTARP